jgi:hypothetical protein
MPDFTGLAIVAFSALWAASPYDPIDLYHDLKRVKNYMGRRFSSHESSSISARNYKI